MRKGGDFEINPDVTDVIYLSEDSKTKNEEEKVKKGTEEFGDEVKACVDSRIYERPSFFLGILFIIVFEASEANMKVSSQLNTKEKS
jgi:hypothetical protein